MPPCERRMMRPGLISRWKPTSSRRKWPSHTMTLAARSRHSKASSPSRPQLPPSNRDATKRCVTKASCLQKQSKYQQATDVLSGILEEASDEDTKTLADACIRLGDCYQASGRSKEAILAYLRVDILFPREKKQHAEALYYLSRLFAQDGKPDKAADAAARLQERYPKSPWTARLTSAAPK